MRNRLRIVDFKPEHFACIRLREEDAVDLAGIEAGQLLGGWAAGRTLLKDEEPAFIYGYCENQGTILLWALSSPLVETLPLLVTRLARNGIVGFLEAGAHRVEVYCHIDNIRSLAWLTRSLGFRVEGLMKRCGPNRQDRFILAITDEDFFMQKTMRQADFTPESKLWRDLVTGSQEVKI